MYLGIPRTPLVTLSKLFLRITRLPTSSPNCQKTKKSCGASRDRTDDPLVANQVLSQLSYSPKFLGALTQVGLRGLEPRTSSLSGMRSNHLSYKPKIFGMRDHKI